MYKNYEYLYARHTIKYSCMFLLILYDNSGRNGFYLHSAVEETESQTELSKLPKATQPQE